MSSRQPAGGQAHPHPLQQGCCGGLCKEEGRSIPGPPGGGVSAVASGWLRLNVGGVVFETTRSTLMKDTGSFLYKLCTTTNSSGGCSCKGTTTPVPLGDDGSTTTAGGGATGTGGCGVCCCGGSSSVGKDSSGAYLIDRDPRYFSIVLNYLRTGKLIIDKDLRIEGVLAEAEFYQLVGLLRLVEETELMCRGRSPSRTVYRVLQCHEDELTQMISTLSDGWKFEQLVSIGSGYNIENSEFLAVVSREIPGSIAGGGIGGIGGGGGPFGGKDSMDHISDKGRTLVSKGSRM